MDNFREEIVAKKNRGVNTALYALATVMMVVFALIAAMMFSSLGAGINVQSIILLLVSAGIAFLLFWKRDNLRTEYEYSLTNGELDFARVLGNKKRKNLGSMTVKNVEAMGHVEHSSFKRYVTMPGVEKTNWFLNRDGNLFYFYYSKDGKKRIIVIEPTEQLVAMFKFYAQRGAFQG
ncbi:hypothetical protein AGMMS49992_14920 [Clostridia bacterium]|nr:hypothetical protein AGMMS49992_14920 [Clostridia bacterium]